MFVDVIVVILFLFLFFFSPKTVSLHYYISHKLSLLALARDVGAIFLSFSFPG